MESEELEKAMQAFLKKGGTITKCPKYARTDPEDIKYKGYRRMWSKKNKSNEKK